MGAIAQVVAAQRILDPETVTWRDGITAQFPASTPNQRAISIANSLIEGIKAASYNTKVISFLPLLGHDLVGATMPLRDALAKGPVGATAFQNSDFDQALGLQADGATENLDSLIKPSELGATNNGGIGYWENNINFTGSSIAYPAGATSNDGTNYFSLFTYSTYDAGFYWGTAANAVLISGSGVNGHYYGQRSSATLREVFFNGSSLGTNTTSDATAGSNERNIYCSAINGSPVNEWKGRCAAFYLTDGTMTSGEVAAFHALLLQNLFGPTGRPSS